MLALFSPVSDSQPLVNHERRLIYVYGPVGLESDVFQIQR